MVSPTLMRRNNPVNGAELNSDAKRLFQLLYKQNKKDPKDPKIDDDTPKISVSEMVSKISFVYEKIRNAVDFDEEHLLRKNAIIRILKRKVVIEGVLKEVNSEQLSSHLLTELIRAGYLPNNTIPETKIKETTLLLDKYLKLKDYSIVHINDQLSLKSDLSQAQSLIKEKNSIIHRILALAACEIEENFELNQVKQAIVSNMFAILSKNLELPKTLPYQDDLEIQTYLSVNRVFMRFDQDMLSLILFKYYNASWAGVADTELPDTEIKRIADNFPIISKGIDDQLKHPLTRSLDRLVKVYSLYYNVFLENIQKDPVKSYAELTSDEGKFVKSIRKTCEAKYKKESSRLWRKAVRSIIYIFFTKSIFVLLIEIPAIKLFNEPLNLFALGINIAFPAALLFLIVLTSRNPNDRNTDKIVSGVKEIALVGMEREQPILIKMPNKRRGFSNFVFNTLYISAFFISSYLIIKALAFINFNWVSMTIFMFFLAFVSFFSIVVTKDVKNLIIVKKKESLLGFIGDIFYMPIIAVGKWLSEKASKLNFFIFIFDFIIEAPLKVLVEVVEDWTKYVRERKENML